MPNVKSSQKDKDYERFGETIRYLTIDEWQQFLDAIENYRHKLMMRVVYELGCRVGEFVRIQLKHLAFGRNTVYFPAENTKTKQRRVSHLPPGLMNELKSLLRQQGRMAQRTVHVHRPDDYLFHPGRNPRRRYTENRLRQIFSRYAQAAGLNREYARDGKGRALHELTESFYGREDKRLTDKLLAELPGILNWAIEGWQRLRERGTFVQPSSVEDGLRDMEDLSSPVGAFVRERCDVAAGLRTWVDDLYSAWREWCGADGRITVTTKQTFGRDLMAAAPGVVSRQSTSGLRFYQGIALKGVTQ